MSSTPPKPRTSDDTPGRRNLSAYFQSWSPREVILLAVACLGVLAAIAFGIAWGTHLVPLETVWGPVASWVNVGVTALGFIVAGLTFYLRFREVAQNDDQKKGEKEKEDLNNTYELHQLTAIEAQRMQEEASMVKLELWPTVAGPSDLPGWERKYKVQLLVTNPTGKRLSDIILRLPLVTTHYGEYSETSLTLGESAESRFSSGLLDPWFAGNLTKGYGQRPDMTGPMGAYEALNGKAALSFRIGGARWNLVFDATGQQRPTLALD